MNNLVNKPFAWHMFGTSLLELATIDPANESIERVPYGWKPLYNQAALDAAVIVERETWLKQPIRQPLTDEQLRRAFANEYPNENRLLCLAENNRDLVMEAIGAQYCWAAFKKGARSIEIAHGIEVGHGRFP